MAGAAGLAVALLAGGGSSNDVEGEPAAATAPAANAPVVAAFAKPGSGLTTLGSLLTGSPAEIGCDGSEHPRACTIVQAGLPGRPLGAPADGLITRWRIRGARGTFALVVLRGTARPRLVRASSFRAVSGTGAHSFPTRLSVSKGDRIGLQVGADAKFSATFADGAQLAIWTPPLNLGEGRRHDRADPLDHELFYNADFKPRKRATGAPGQASTPQAGAVVATPSPGTTTPSPAPTTTGTQTAAPTTTTVRPRRALRRLRRRG